MKIQNKNLNLFNVDILARELHVLEPTWAPDDTCLTGKAEAEFKPPKETLLTPGIWDMEYFNLY